MTGKWSWFGGYVLMIVVALVLGGIIGELSLFKQATLGTPKLTASGLVRFLSYAGALLLLWMTSDRTATQLHQQGGRFAFFGYILVPLATLIVVIGAYAALLEVLKPFLGASVRNIYNWLFVLAITASAVWLAMAFFQHSQSLMELFKSGVAGAAGGTARKCNKCGATLAEGAQFCHKCGTAAA